jgi:hypothetical protein
MYRLPLSFPVSVFLPTLHKPSQPTNSCSVLIERFHHSLFLYVLTGLNHYVSVERYIGPLVALIGVMVLQVRGMLERGEKGMVVG